MRPICRGSVNRWVNVLAIHLNRHCAAAVIRVARGVDVVVERIHPDVELFASLRASDLPNNARQIITSSKTACDLIPLAYMSASTVS